MKTREKKLEELSYEEKIIFILDDICGTLYITSSIIIGFLFSILYYLSK